MALTLKINATEFEDLRKIHTILRYDNDKDQGRLLAEVILRSNPYLQNVFTADDGKQVVGLSPHINACVTIAQALMTTCNISGYEFTVPERHYETSDVVARVQRNREQLNVLLEFLVEGGTVSVMIKFALVVGLLLNQNECSDLSLDQILIHCLRGLVPTEDDEINLDMDAKLIFELYQLVPQYLELMLMLIDRAYTDVYHPAHEEIREFIRNMPDVGHALAQAILFSSDGGHHTMTLRMLFGDLLKYCPCDTDECSTSCKIARVNVDFSKPKLAEHIIKVFTGIQYTPKMRIANQD